MDNGSLYYSVGMFIRFLISPEGWMFLMFTLALCGVIALAQIRGLLRRILEELESHPSRVVEDDVPRIGMSLE